MLAVLAGCIVVPLELDGLDLVVTVGVDWPAVELVCGAWDLVATVEVFVVGFVVVFVVVTVLELIDVLRLDETGEVIGVMARVLRMVVCAPVLVVVDATGVIARVLCAVCPPVVVGGGMHLPCLAYSEAQKKK